jgi:hypothetical protein
MQEEFVGDSGHHQQLPALASVTSVLPGIIKTSNFDEGVSKSS